MQKILPILGMLVAVNAAATGNYEIKGQINDYNGRVFLVSLNEDKSVDTLSMAMAVNGAFALRGSVDTPRVAELHADDTEIAVPVFLEEADFQIIANAEQPDEYVVCGGGHLQNVAAEYGALKLRSQERQDSITQYFEANYDMNERFMRQQLRHALSDESKLFDKEEDEFISTHDNMVSSFVLCHSLDRITQNKSVTRKYELLGENARNSVPGHLLKPIAEKFAQITVGGILPDITLYTPEGEKQSLHSTNGKVKIVDFWASWCGPCRAEIPKMKEIYAKYKDKGLVIVGLSMDANRDAWIRALEAEQMEWPQLCGFMEELDLVRSTYQVFAIPYMFVLDQDNRIIAEGLRGDKLMEFISQCLD